MLFQTAERLLCCIFSYIVVIEERYSNFLIITIRNWFHMQRLYSVIVILFAPHRPITQIESVFRAYLLEYNHIRNPFVIKGTCDCDGIMENLKLTVNMEPLTDGKAIQKMKNIQLSFEYLFSIADILEPSKDGQTTQYVCKYVGMLFAYLLQVIKFNQFKLMLLDLLVK